MASDDPELQSPCTTPRFQLNGLGTSPTNEIERWAMQIAAAFQDTGSEATLNIGGTAGHPECTDDSNGGNHATTNQNLSTNAGNSGLKRELADASSSNDSSASGSNPKKKRKKRKVKKPGDRHYCLLLRSDSFTGPPMIKQWIGKETPKQNGSFEPRMPALDPRDPTYAVSLKIGPMNKVEAKDFHRNWTKSTQSDKLIYERETVGRKLAVKQGFKFELMNQSAQLMSLPPQSKLPVISEGTKVG